MPPLGAPRTQIARSEEVTGVPATRFHGAVEHDPEHAFGDGIERVGVGAAVNANGAAGAARTLDVELFERHRRAA